MCVAVADVLPCSLQLVLQNRCTVQHSIVLVLVAPLTIAVVTDMTIEARVREIISPSIDEWIGQKIDTAELERRKELARQQAVAEDSGGSTAAAAALLAAALEAAAANPNLNPNPNPSPAASSYFRQHALAAVRPPSARPLSPVCASVRSHSVSLTACKRRPS